MAVTGDDVVDCLKADCQEEYPEDNVSESIRDEQSVKKKDELRQKGA